MIPKDKWLAGTLSTDAVTDVARRAIHQRSLLVFHFLPLAAEKPEEDIEYVHQLRVSTRRTVAALDVFAAVLPPRKAKRIRRKYQQIRRSAGDARDLDVLMLQLAESRELPMATRQQYQAALRKLRKKAQGPIVERFKRTKKKNVAERTGKLVTASRWRESTDEPLLCEFAGDVFTPMMKDFLQMGAGDLSDFAQLHELRILGKRLRYAMELLSAGFHKQFRSDLYPLVEQLQEKLGLINDYASASTRCQKWLQQIPADPDQWKHLAEVQQQAADQAADDFRKWWTGGRLDELRERWERIQAKSTD